MTKMPRQFKYEKQVWALGACVGVLVASYIVFVGSTVYNTLERQRAERQISELTSELSEREFAYLNLKAKINPELARTLGFVEVHDIIVAKDSPRATAFAKKERI